MKNGEIIEVNGIRYRVELHEVKVPTYEEALKVVKPLYWITYTSTVINYRSLTSLTGNVPTEKDALSLIAYRKLKVFEAFYNEGQEAKCWVVLNNGRFAAFEDKDVFGLKDEETAQLFIENHRELLDQFYQL